MLVSVVVGSIVVAMFLPLIYIILGDTDTVGGGGRI